jgi:hypothetical protein
MSSLSREDLQQQGTRTKSKTSAVDIVAVPTFLAIPQKKFRDIIEELPVHFWVHDENFTIVHTNSRFRNKYGNCNGKLCHRCIMKNDQVCSCCMSGQTLKSKSVKKCSNSGCLAAGRNTHIFHRPFAKKDGSKYVLKSMVEMDSMHDNLSEYENEYESPGENMLNVFWTMCSGCKKIKDGKNKWITLETFLIQYLNIVISHGICPSCIRRLYPELEKP